MIFCGRRGMPVPHGNKHDMCRKTGRLFSILVSSVSPARFRHSARDAAHIPCTVKEVDG